jgi:hypothetical protein
MAYASDITTALPSLSRWEQEFSSEISKIKDLPARAEKLTKDLQNLNWEPFQVEATKFFYYQGTRILNQVASVNVVGTASLADFGRAAQNMIKQGQQFIESDGAADKIAAIDGMLKSMGGILSEALEGTDAQGVVNEIFSWAGIATGCGVMMIPPNTIWGGIACGMTILAKVLGAFTSPERYHLPIKRDALPAVYMPHSEQLPIIRADAQRLAACLAFIYGVDSFDAFIPYLDAVRHSEKDDIRWYEYASGYPMNPGINLETKAMNQPLEPIPGMSPLAILMALGALDKADPNPDTLWSTLPTALWCVASAVCDHDWDLHACQGERGYPGVDKLFDRMFRMHDINVAAIETGASMGRGCLQAFGTPWTEIMALNRFPKVNVRCPFEVFIRYDELLNYFVAVTLKDLDFTDAKPKELHPFLPYFERELPIRLYDAFDQDGQTPYDKNMWTRLNKGCSPLLKGGMNPEQYCSTKPGRTIERAEAELIAQGKATPRTFRGYANNFELEQGVFARDPFALKEFASLRLMTAFSELLLLFQWSASRGAPVKQGDMIYHTSPKRQGLAPTDISFQMRAPVDPRQMGNVDGEWRFAKEEQRSVTIAMLEAVVDMTVLRPIKIPVAGQFYTLPQYTDASCRSKSQLDGFYLANQVTVRQQQLQDVINTAYRRAASEFQLPVTKTNEQVIAEMLKRVSSTKVVMPTSIKSQTALLTKPLTMIQEGKLKLTTPAQAAMDCRAAGGVPVTKPDGAVTCVAPGKESGGGLGTLAVLGGAAYLISKFWK